MLLEVSLGYLWLLLFVKPQERWSKVGICKMEGRVPDSELQLVKNRFSRDYLHKMSIKTNFQIHPFFSFRTIVGLNSITSQICNRYITFFPFIFLSSCYSKSWQQYFKACISQTYVLRKCYNMESLGAHM